VAHPPDITPFQVVFADTTIGGQIALDVGRPEDPVWQAAARRMLDTAAGRHGGAATEDAAWEELLRWLQVDASLGSFLQRIFQTIDAAVWLIAESARELSDADDISGVLHALQQRADRLRYAVDPLE
jgi:hypothetical protein